MTGARVVHVDCPACGLPLPPILVEYDTRSTGRVEAGGVVLQVTVTAQELDAAWWSAARNEHPGCIPPRPRVRDWM